MTRVDRRITVLIMAASMLASAGLRTANADIGQTLRRHGTWLVSDPVNLVRDTKGGYLYVHAGILAASGLLMLPEDEIRFLAREHYADGPASPFTYANLLGSRGAFALAALGYGATLFSHNQRLQDAAFTSIQAALYAQTFTTAYKFIFGRARPSQTRPSDERGQRVFAPFSGNSSFPSGHATTAFALVTPWFLYYPHWTTGLVFLAAAGTCVARLGLDMHWTTDVLAGAGIGFATGFCLSRIHKEERAAISVLPRAGRGSIGLTMIADF